MRIELIEAKDLLKADYGILGLSTSDPYCIINNSIQTQVISRNCNPQWNFIAELAISDLEEQEITIEVFDKDQVRSKYKDAFFLVEL